MAKNKKLSDKEFWAILRKNAGLYARTARAITAEYGMPYSRQAVRDRAESKPELLKDILEEGVDIAEEGLHELMRSILPNIRLKAIELFLKSKGKDRGYFDNTKQTLEGDVSVTVRFVEPDTKDNEYRNG